MKIKMAIMDGNEAVAYIAYRVTEINAIYPITPSTPMGEFADQWASNGIRNIWNIVPQVIEMQSEGGVSGVLHGALQGGALATTYTASQGLLLMIPNMYKIAGELTATVIHVASRSLACQGLSIFGDHSDVMGVRDTGFVMLASGSVQEAHDLALIAHAATLETRIPIIHFFEGFRVSHEINKIELINNEQIRSMIDEELVLAHRDRALSPERPCIRGTSQNPDVYFQGRETVNSFYLKVPDIIEKYMNRFAALTNRKYSLMSYHGDRKAERIIVIIGSAAKVVIEAVDKLNAEGEKVGIIQVYLYRPFPLEQFIRILPSSVKILAALDRTKSPGSLGEPLYQDVLTSIVEAIDQRGVIFAVGCPKVVGGRYGLSSKEFTPAMAKGVFDNLKNIIPRNHFTIGIKDDLTNTSLDYEKNFITENPRYKCAIFYGLGSDGTIGANKSTIRIIGQETSLYVQGYFVHDSKKSGSKTISHLRFSHEPIQSPYLITAANFIACHQFKFVESEDILDNAATDATFLLNSPFGPNEIWHRLPQVVAKKIITKKIKFYIIDAYKIATKTGMGTRINTIMQTCFFAISGILPRIDAIAEIKKSIALTYKKKGEEVIKKNFAAVDQTLSNLFEVNSLSEIPISVHDLAPIVSDKAPEFVRKIIAVMMKGQGDDLPVSLLPNDGTYPIGTSKWEKRNISSEVAEWNPDLCIQCGHCSLICPHGAIRVKHFSKNDLKVVPIEFKTTKCLAREFANDDFRLQVYIEDCTGCGLCNEICPAISKERSDIKAIMITPKNTRLENERKNIDFFTKISDTDKSKINNTSIRGIQYLHPYFEFSCACAGCGETPYIKLISQLFGDRMLVANATGCSSIYGGNLPTTPWTCDSFLRGPAWSNSLFEDNAEFGLGFRLSTNGQQKLALELLQKFSLQVGDELVEAVISGINKSDEKNIIIQRQRLNEIKEKLMKIPNLQIKHLLTLLEYLVKRSIWIIGGDGWAYDIGYGGLDHVLASGHDVNILVLDTEVYSNTGGQASKATPRGAITKFANSGKIEAPKDLGMMAVTYNNVYVAQIALGANPTQAIRAFIEAENYPGPSLIIAYSHCIAHGYELRQGITQQKLAVDSGFWPLYRYHPERIKQGLNPLQLDSKNPSITVRDFICNEPRFNTLISQNTDQAEKLLQSLQIDVDRRWKKYTSFAATTI
ncbi:MAG: pyruvate:ferredoxin (flavodoxin) oxidoreductase [Coxiellaceae bacterium]|jgi:pyruvate-ferredoxin/flavodoxin oxidoreductase|nr:pyruvate:ferredoxin (flavodoxin) oxidoreductase [Coxiellaceae bacterium]